MGMRHLLSTCVFVFLFSTLAFSASFDKNSPIRLGMSIPLSGTSQVLGAELLAGAKPVFDEVNRRGGINGRPITLLVADDAYNPDRTIENTLKFVGEEKVDFLFGYIGTPTVTRVLPLLKVFSNKGLFLFFPFTGAQPQRVLPYSAYVYNFRASYLEETEALVNHFIKIGRPRVAVFYQMDAYGRNGWSGVRAALMAKGLKMTGEATYLRGSKLNDSYVAQAKLLLAGHPDAIVMVGSYQAAAGCIRDLRQMGSTIPIANISFVGSDSVVKSLATLKDGKFDYTQGLVFSHVVPPVQGSKLKAAQAFLKTMTDAGSLDKVSSVSFEGYLDAVLMVQLLKTGLVDHKSKVHSILKNHKGFDIGLDHPVDFKMDNQAIHDVYFSTVKSDRLVPLLDWTPWKK